MAAITLEVNGRQYQFQMGIEQMQQLEEVFSTPEKEVTFLDVMQKVHQGRPKYFHRFIWASLQLHHPELTMSDAATIINDAGGMYALDALLLRLLQQAQPDPADIKALGIDKANPPKAQAKRAKKRGDSFTSMRAVPA